MSVLNPLFGGDIYASRRAMIFFKTITLFLLFILAFQKFGFWAACFVVPLYAASAYRMSSTVLGYEINLTETLAIIVLFIMFGTSPKKLYFKILRISTISTLLIVLIYTYNVAYFFVFLCYFYLYVYEFYFKKNLIEKCSNIIILVLPLVLNFHRFINIIIDDIHGKQYLLNRTVLSVQQPMTWTTYLEKIDDQWQMALRGIWQGNILKDYVYPFEGALVPHVLVVLAVAGIILAGIKRKFIFLNLIAPFHFIVMHVLIGLETARIWAFTIFGLALSAISLMGHIKIPKTKNVNLVLAISLIPFLWCTQLAMEKNWALIVEGLRIRSSDNTIQINLLDFLHQNKQLTTVSTKEEYINAQIILVHKIYHIEKGTPKEEIDKLGTENLHTYDETNLEKAMNSIFTSPENIFVTRNFLKQHIHGENRDIFLNSYTEYFNNFIKLKR
jgi:hypothetical protein